MESYVDDNLKYTWTQDENTEEYFTSKLNSLGSNDDFAIGFYLLQNIMHQIAKSKGWHTPSKTFGEQIVMMHSELSEAIEEYRREDGNATKIWHSHPQTVRTDNDGCIELVTTGSKPEGVPIELADLFIRLLDVCELYNINLLEATLQKAQYNLSRSQRHGNKKI